MERGQRENRCLKLVQNAMFTQNGEPVRNFITHKNCFEVSDEEFEKNQILYINGNCSKIYFGLIEENRKEIKIDSYKICDILGCEKRTKLKEIYTDLEKKILYKELINDEVKIKQYLIKEYLN